MEGSQSQENYRRTKGYFGCQHITPSLKESAIRINWPHANDDRLMKSCPSSSEIVRRDLSDKNSILSLRLYMQCPLIYVVGPNKNGQKSAHRHVI